MNAINDKFDRNSALTWLSQFTIRERLLLAINQPMTATQLSCRLRMSASKCGKILQEMVKRKLICCMTPNVRRSRLYFPTRNGRLCVKEINDRKGIYLQPYILPNIDWKLYGWTCYRHRTAVLKALSKPLQPSEIRRRATWSNPKLCMSANNVRDVIYAFYMRGIVRRIKVKDNPYWLYELTEIGKTFRQLHLNCLIR